MIHLKDCQGDEACMCAHFFERFPSSHPAPAEETPVDPIPVTAADYRRLKGIEAVALAHYEALLALTETLGHSGADHRFLEALTPFVPAGSGGEPPTGKESLTVAADEDGGVQSAEQQARDMLERAGVRDAQGYSSGDVVELANLIADHARLVEALEQKTKLAEHWEALALDYYARLERAGVSTGAK